MVVRVCVRVCVFIFFYFFYIFWGVGGGGGWALLINLTINNFLGSPCSKFSSIFGVCLLMEYILGGLSLDIS